MTSWSCPSTAPLILPNIDRVADSLASLWPGLLAPADVELVVVNGDTWDAEAMALRFHQRRTIG